MWINIFRSHGLTLDLCKVVCTTTTPVSWFVSSSFSPTTPRKRLRCDATWVVNSTNYTNNSQIAVVLPMGTHRNSVFMRLVSIFRKTVMSCFFFHHRTQNGQNSAHTTSLTQLRSHEFIAVRLIDFRIANQMSFPGFILPSGLCL